MKFVLASHNRGKLAEMRKILGEMGVEVVLQSDMGLALEPEETGTTFAENALIKAKAVMEASGLPAIADDSGLCVDYLGGGPGIYSARYGGLDDDKARYTLLLNNMRGATTRAAHFHTSIVCAFPDGDVLEAEGDCHGTIAFAPMGESGFGYDPVFFVPSLRKTFAQLTPEEKNAISHRGNALRAFADKLKEYMENN
ncbi:MAG: RdgB/HAM1 family non-canonical purine NTP pyrophosphatase [Clostridiales bacterium]|nr:RdgB/HAM1 family non-canonical purine NTP pyrophosphatase [Candidatus Cacconaster stercorequi]